jgi:ribulose kinase
MVPNAHASATIPAIHGVVAAIVKAGSYEDIVAAARQMGGLRSERYRPILEHVKVYDRVYTTGERRTML